MHALASLTYLLHPLGYCAGTARQVAQCRSLNLYSGIGSDIGELSLVTVAAGTAATIYHTHRCTHCKRWGRHPVQVHGAGVTHTYRSCRNHLDDDHAAKARGLAPSPSEH